MTTYRSEPLRADHEVADFACGRSELDTWLREQAWRAQRQGSARTTVWVAPASRTVLAYYSVAPTTVARAGLSRSASGGISSIPGYLVARLALSHQLHDQGLGGQLLLDALETVCWAADRAGGRLIVVDPIDASAAAFYRHHGFLEIEGSPRMYQLIDRAHASLDSAE